mmetsp:Transcript_22696/g.41025  ORF Transcript_22696/g.41025 Transcript_22696/m.41025 type:complete len:709 (-) Transcript_22696:251-2377(-)|eukprot:CAMPEP_0198295350 /NCGR_PEP_ID=MMETSP1449-20131203/27338_1 /TAXON_ID=420275 /ORGANISM="Attheya septentrionalis, Strain CCMP2084" /LENGTH=708 /DNA_ID=CAMNT_0043995635 /DNA_START=235 /DNA_END=2361 /DNA_ORIENTATION=-
MGSGASSPAGANTNHDTASDQGVRRGTAHTSSRRRGARGGDASASIASAPEVIGIPSSPSSNPPYSLTNRSPTITMDPHSSTHYNMALGPSVPSIPRRSQGTSTPEGTMVAVRSSQRSPFYPDVDDDAVSAMGLDEHKAHVHSAKTPLNPASEINSRLDTQVEVRVYPCNNNNSQHSSKKKFTTFTVKPEGVVIQGTNRNRASAGNDLGGEYALHMGRKLNCYELSDTRACQLLVTTHAKSFWVVPAPEAFSRHSGTCRLLGDRKHPPANHTLQVGDFLRVGSVGVVVIETHNGVQNRVLSEEKIQKIMKDTTSPNGGFLDLGETDGENSDDSVEASNRPRPPCQAGDAPLCYMCFDEEDTPENPLITPCKCLGDTRYVHVECLRKWHSAEADNQICFLSSVDATCSVCKSTFKSDFKLRDGRLVKLFKSSLEPPYVSLLVATKHEMAQRLFNTRFQLSFSTLLKPDGRNGTRPLLLGRSSGSDMVLDYRTVSARHASIKFKNGEFIFTDAGSSNGSYLYLRRPVELSPTQSVQFRLGRSMISMKVVNKWNRRLLRAVRRGNTGAPFTSAEGDDLSIGSNDDDIRITDGRTGDISKVVPRRTRDSIMNALPSPGTLSQNSPQHLDLLYALAYPKRSKEVKRKDSSGHARIRHINEPTEDESKMEEAAMEMEGASPSSDENEFSGKEISIHGSSPRSCEGDLVEKEAEA